MHKLTEQQSWANFLCATIIAGRGHITVPDAVNVANQALEAMKTRFDPKPKLAEVVSIHIDGREEKVDFD